MADSSYSAQRSASINGVVVRFLDSVIVKYSLAQRLHPATLAIVSAFAQKNTSAVRYALFDANNEATMNNTTAVKDPVCGMDVEIATAARRTEHNGQTYYFCGSKCQDKFDLSPEQYLGKAPGKPQSGQGCCS